MGWKENRRRKRTWYRHYRWLADQVRTMMNRGEFAPEAIVEIMYRLYESRRMHGKRFIAESAYESMCLACEDAGLGRYSLQERRFATGRPPGIAGELRRPDQVRTTRYPGRGRPQASGEGVRRGYVTPTAENPPEEMPQPMPELPAAALAQLRGDPLVGLEPGELNVIAGPADAMQARDRLFRVRRPEETDPPDSIPEPVSNADIVEFPRAPEAGSVMLLDAQGNVIARRGVVQPPEQNDPDIIAEVRRVLVADTETSPSREDLDF